MTKLARREALAALAAFGALALVGPGVAVAGGSSKVKKGPKKPKIVTSSTGLRYQDLTVGAGDPPRSGQRVSVHYVGSLEDGTVFDSSRARNAPFVFTVGAKQVIAGFDEGVASMRVGGTRKIWIPPDLGYGDRGAGGGKIPPDATLIFELELLAVATTR